MPSVIYEEIIQNEEIYNEYRQELFEDEIDDRFDPMNIEKEVHD